MEDTVWILWFEQERDDGEDTELLLGVFRTEDAANAAGFRLKDKPGFVDYQQGFKTYQYTLDKCSWLEGFVRE